MFALQNFVSFLLTATLLFCNQSLMAQTTANNNDNILDLIIPVIISTQGSTLSSLANASGISLNEIEHIYVAHYTTGWDTKTDCVSTFEGSDWCNGWATFYRDQVCTWYLDVPTGSSIIMRVQVAKENYNTLINNLVAYIKDQITGAIGKTLADSAVAAFVAALISDGAGAAPAFTSTFSNTIGGHLIEAGESITLYMKTVFTAKSAELISNAFPVITSDNMHQSCNWSEWKHI